MQDSRAFDHPRRRRDRWIWFPLVHVWSMAQLAGRWSGHTGDYR
jgi:hypothetical protein